MQTFLKTVLPYVFCILAGYLAGAVNFAWLLAKKRGFDISLLTDIINKLAAGEPLPEKNRDHQLSGDYAGCRECHITPDWLLIYEVDGDELILYLTRTGSHSDLF